MGETRVCRQRSAPDTLGYPSLRTGSSVVWSRSSDKLSISVEKNVADNYREYYKMAL